MTEVLEGPKVFGIGFHKTGTTSLKRALEALGYRVTGPNGVREPRIERRALSLALDLVPQYDAFQDNPWPLLFREMDERFPGSRFILTVRPSEDWLESVVRHFGSGSTPMREWIYGAGSPVGNEQLYIERMEAHNGQVRRHFRDRPEDLLEWRLTEGDGWGPLCAFLGAPIPDQDFPHANPAGSHLSDDVDSLLASPIRRFHRLVRRRLIR